MGPIAIGDASNGVCGGMVYAAMDLYFAHPRLLPPATTTLPAGGSTLTNYIIDRLIDGFAIQAGPMSNANRYIEFMSIEDHDTWFKPGVPSIIANLEWPQIKADIDAGRHETDDTFDFHLADWNGDGRPDLIAIKKANTGTHSTEVHVLSGASNFQSFILQTGTVLPETDSTFSLAVADWNGDGRPDLIAIKKSATGTGSTEVHVLSGAANFQAFLLQTGTALPETDDTWDFAVTDWDANGTQDLVAVKKSATGSNSTEVHVLAQ